MKISSVGPGQRWARKPDELAFFGRTEISKWFGRVKRPGAQID